MSITSRHPKINYWFWDENTLQNNNHLTPIDTISNHSAFDLIFITQRGNLNFWDAEKFAPLFRETVEYAHSKGIKIALQLWPEGEFQKATIPFEQSVALVTEYEAVVSDNTVIINACGKNARHPEYASPLKSQLLFAAVFEKTGEGTYREESFCDVTQRAKIKENPNHPETLDIQFEINKAEGLILYAMVAHYYEHGDLFCEYYPKRFQEIMDCYQKIPFDGFGLDEFKNIPIIPPWKIPQSDPFRERIYGTAFHRYFLEQTGEDLIKIMFEMRFCPENQDEIRIKAINQYFDIFRHSTLKTECFVADCAKKTFGQDIFIGIHNTYHNHLQNDEIWQTCCNWWEIPRNYAQTDEDISYPVRMGIACGCPENLIYDMYYTSKEEKFFEKAIRDARFNCRIHYHAMNDGSDWGIDTGSPEFLDNTRELEQKISLLNCYDTTLPRMELLVVFGFPALCNWYPDPSARNKMDINGSLNIFDRITDLWNRGYWNALAPSDALSDGRITIKDGIFDYCGHKFKKLLYLYPEYSKAYVNQFLESAEQKGCEFSIIGKQTRDFEGKPAKISVSPDHFLTEESDVAKEMKLEKSFIEQGCITEDGSVIITDLNSITKNGYYTATFSLNNHDYKAKFKGVFAFLPNEIGNIKKLAAGNLQFLKKDDKILIEGQGKDTIVL